MMKVMYSLNILVAGWIAICSLFFPKTAVVTVFSNAYLPSEFIRLVGCFWLAIMVLSAMGLWQPMAFTSVFLFQLIYKSAWLIIVALPAIQRAQSYPKGMALFFLIWVIILPIVIPWKHVVMAFRIS